MPSIKMVEAELRVGSGCITRFMPLRKISVGSGCYVDNKTESTSDAIQMERDIANVVSDTVTGHQQSRRNGCRTCLAHQQRSIAILLL